MRADQNWCCLYLKNIFRKQNLNVKAKYLRRLVDCKPFKQNNFCNFTTKAKIKRPTEDSVSAVSVSAKKWLNIFLSRN